MIPTSAIFLLYLLKTITVSASHDLPTDDAEFAFGPVTVLGSALFYRTQLSLASVNKNPMQPGHVLVIPVRKVARLKDLSREEVQDLFLTVQKVAEFLEEFYGVTATTVSINDGPDAGQIIPQVHVHVVPWKKADFVSVDEKLHKWRDVNDMAKEAKQYREAWTE